MLATCILKYSGNFQESGLYPVDVPANGHCVPYSLFLLLTEQLGQRQTGSQFMRNLKDSLVEQTNKADFQEKVPQEVKETWQSLVDDYIGQKTYNPYICDAVLDWFSSKYAVYVNIFWCECEERGTDVSCTKRIVGNGETAVDLGYFREHVWPIFKSENVQNQLMTNYESKVGNLKIRLVWRPFCPALPATVKPHETILIEDSEDDNESDDGFNDIERYDGLDDMERDDGLDDIERYDGENDSEYPRSRTESGTSTSEEEMVIDDLLPSDLDVAYESFGQCGQWPILTKQEKFLPSRMAANLILNAHLILSEKICETTPSQFVDEAVFMIDRSKHGLHHLKDVLCDDTGAYGTNVTRHESFRASDHGPVFSGSRSAPVSEYPFDLVIRYSYHKNTPQFKRGLFEVLDRKNNAILDISLLQYCSIDDQKVEVNIEEMHGNSKRQNHAYRRTSKQCKDAVTELSKTTGPVGVMKAMTSKAGGICNVSDSRSLPRTERAVAYCKSKLPVSEQYHSKHSSGQKRHEFDDVYALAAAGRVFACAIIDRSPYAMICSPQQQKEIAAIVNKNKGGPVCIDSTYNLGSFFVTATAYRHPAFVNKRTGRIVTLVGPVLMHIRLTKAQYDMCCSLLKQAGMSPFAFGSDNDHGLVSATSEAFPDAIQLRCEIHLRDNIETCMKNLGISQDVISKVLNAIFAKDSVVDANSEEEFDEKLQILRDMHPLVDFWTLFIQNYRKTFLDHVIASVRSLAGLGSPPARFTTNQIESVNSLLKLEAKHQGMSWRDFVLLVEKHQTETEEEMKKAKLGYPGTFVLSPEFEKYGVNESRLHLMSKEQKQTLCRKFLSFQFEDELIMDFSEAFPQLSVTAEQVDLPFLFATQKVLMFNLAREITSKGSLITNVVNPDACVLFRANNANFNINRLKPGTYNCNCELFGKNGFICSHTIVAAESKTELLLHLKSVNTSWTTATAIDRSIPKTAGKKQPRKGRSTKPKPLCPDPKLSQNSSELPGPLNTVSKRTRLTERIPNSQTAPKRIQHTLAPPPSPSICNKAKFIKISPIPSLTSKGEHFNVYVVYC